MQNEYNQRRTAYNKEPISFMFDATLNKSIKISALHIWVSCEYSECKNLERKFRFTISDLIKFAQSTTPMKNTHMPNKRRNFRNLSTSNTELPSIFFLMRMILFSFTFPKELNGSCLKYVVPLQIVDESSKLF